MSPDDIDHLALAIFDYMVDIGHTMDEDEDWTGFLDLLHHKLDRFVTRERNYN